jgi:hypothetical protein
MPPLWVPLRGPEVLGPGSEALLTQVSNLIHLSSDWLLNIPN